MPVTISDGDFAQLQGLVNSLGNDRASQASAKLASDNAHAALASAQSAVTTADAAEASAIAQVDSDAQALQKFIDNLVSPPAPSPGA